MLSLLLHLLVGRCLMPCMRVKNGWMGCSPGLVRYSVPRPDLAMGYWGGDIRDVSESSPGSS